MTDASKIRPYWHVDLKWVFGILLFLSLAVSSILFLLSTLLSPNVAVPSATYIVATQFSKNGLDDRTEIQQIQKKMEALGVTTLQPIEGADVQISKDELSRLSPREIRLKIFRQVVEPIYYRSASSKSNEQAMKQYGALAFLTSDTHRLISALFWWSLAPVALFMAGMVFFSWRYGRLVSPAIMLLLFGTGPTLLILLIINTVKGSTGEDQGGILSPELTKDIAAAVLPYYLTMFLTGICLVVAAVIIKLVMRKQHSK